MEVHLNGNKQCTAGIGIDGVLSTIINVVGRAEVYYEMGSALAASKFLIWAKSELRVGDEITIRIVEREAFDSPIERKTEAEALGN
jgi:hypothetical protein